MKQLITLCFLICSLAVQAQDIKSLFVALPDSLSPLLSKVNREDFGDFLSNNMKAEVKNRFGRSSQMLKMTDDYLQLKLTSVSSAEMKLLPVNDSTQVICVVKTYRGPVIDSEVKFYTTEWKELPATDFLQYPDRETLYTVPESSEKRDSLELLKAQADMDLYKIRLSQDKPEMYLTYTTPDFLEKEAAKSLRAFLCKDFVCYRWENGKFVQK